MTTETSSSMNQAESKNNESTIPKYTLRAVATYMLANGILLFFIPQFFSIANLGFITLVSILSIFVILNVAAAIQIYRQKKQGIILGIIGLVPFCFGLSVKAFSYKFQTLFDIFLSLEFLENGDFSVGFNLGLIANSIDAYINVGEIGITINFVAIAALSFLVVAYLKQKETGQFPMSGY